MEGRTPFEITLMLRSHTQMRDVCRNRISKFDSFAPSANLEGELGFDLEIRNLKGTVFQYKRPHERSKTRSFTIRYSGERKDSLRQLKVLKNYNKRFGGDAAFYAMPLLTEHSDLQETLQRTAFVKARVIPDDASVLHIPPDYCENGRQKSNKSIRAYCSPPDDPTSTHRDVYIDSSHVYGWWNLYEGILDCNLGFRIRWERDDQEESNSYRSNYHHDHDYYYKDDNEIFDQKTLFGLGKQTGRVITRFGDDSDTSFSRPLSKDEYRILDMGS